MNKQTAINILENIDFSTIPMEERFWWNNAQEAISTVLELIENIEALEDRAYDAERDLDNAQKDLYDAKGEIKDLEEEIENLNKTIEDKDDEIERLENIIAELERGDAA